MANRKNEYVKRRWAELIEEFGGACAHCADTLDLEFAHTKPTECRGRGRGKERRLLDVLKHRHCYILLCMSCHDVFDGRPVRRRQSQYALDV